MHSSKPRYDNHRRENLNWHEIRSLNNSQREGFEELCAQLARAKSPDDAEFFRKGTPDAGVECYCVLPNGDEWGWQAKFVSELGRTQWREFDDSVKRALKKHPRLTRFFVCAPKNRAEDRVEGRNSAMDQWNDRVEGKWKGWATERGMDVNFIWWGSSELIDLLSRDEHIGRRMFWFDQRFFNHDWFRKRLDETVLDAGPRYTPEIHVELPIVQELERFSRSDLLFSDVKSCAIGIRKACTSLASAKRALEHHIRGVEIDDLLVVSGSIIEGLRQVEASPNGVLPFDDISKATRDAAETANEVLMAVRDLQLQAETNDETTQNLDRNLQSRFRDCVYYLRYLISALEETTIICNHADKLANSDVLLIKGDAGTGKTHLLCDFAKKRLEAKYPTVLLLGQSFRGDDDPWTRLLENLDLHGISAEQFVGSLEAAAQTSNSRALLMIDALNEGDGRNIWLEALPSFLSRIKDSQWIDVVLSVRTSYEDALIPDNVRDEAVILTHYGFEDAEYDAIASYFAYHGIEISSSPLLQPEFNNPLFLKTICKGLEERGETRIPVGFQGITAVFNLYIDTVNKRLSQELDYDSRNNLVRSALDSIAKTLVKTERRWIPRDLAIEIVNTLLSGQGFGTSLYQSLVSEGVLLEDLGWAIDDAEEVVFISYDRYADHIIADRLLQEHIGEQSDSSTDKSKPRWTCWQSRFAILDHLIPNWLRSATPCARGLPFLGQRKGYLNQGLLEALCVQVPEKTGQELIRLEPRALELSGIEDAYLQSLIWRGLDGFSDDSHAVLSQLTRDGDFWENPLHSLLTVSTVPGHVFNAEYLDERLRGVSMPERDSWWSVFLHEAWERGRGGAVHRLVDWASSIAPNDQIETPVVDLATTTLVWTFTSSNRYLRDKATKALVALLTGRHDSIITMLRRFADVDDLYVTERVYAVVYGLAMRSHDADEVGELATLVYDRIFVDGTPPAHILLRDYAQGVVERAAYLGTGDEFDTTLIRPPYRSEWPSIPSEESVEELFHETKDRGRSWRSAGWSLGRIRSSVLNDDFYSYVIGKDSLSNWLELKLSDPPWISTEDRKKCLLSRLSDSESASWMAYQDAKQAEPVVVTLNFVGEDRKIVETETRLPDGVDQNDVEEAQKHTERKYAQLIELLAAEHRIELEAILSDEQDLRKTNGPRFDKKKIQRYILGRVIDLGWTVERFGAFDQLVIGRSGREASKPERIGKKYQWIAYHEILAYISDHFHYRYPYYDEQDEREYKGPWQELLRDLDPSCTLPSVPGGTGWESHTKTWWAKEAYEEWVPGVSHEEWHSSCDDLPKIEHLLVAKNPNDDSRWLNVNGSFVWRQPNPPDEDPFENNRREIWIGTTGYFVRKRDADSFMDWAKTVHFWGRWMPEPPALHSVYLGEYGWSPAYQHYFSDVEKGKDWVRPTRFNIKACPVKIQLASFEYETGSGDFDCSIDEGFSLGLPHSEFIDHFGLQWFGKGVEYLDAEGRVAAFDPTVTEPGPNATLLREDLLSQYLDDRDLVLCWVVVGEKWITGGDAVNVYRGRLQISGAYRFTESGPKGSIIAKLDLPKCDAGE